MERKETEQDVKDVRLVLGLIEERLPYGNVVTKAVIEGICRSIIPEELEVYVNALSEGGGQDGAIGNGIDAGHYIRFAEDNMLCIPPSRLRVEEEGIAL